MIRRVVAGAFCFALLSLPALERPAHAQGSTGGSIGDTEKSISGSRERRATRHLPGSPAAAAAQTGKPSPCGHVAGTWSWFNGGTAVIRADGTAGGGAVTGNWSCINGKVVIVWSNGYNDRLSLSADGNHLEGTNGFIRVFGDRK
jgi:hypothetical protein